ncbi:MAG: hypothetical protein MdMp014T_0523 [Treponematales bacterium]
MQGNTFLLALHKVSIEPKGLSAEGLEVFAGEKDFPVGAREAFTGEKRFPAGKREPSAEEQEASAGEKGQPAKAWGPPAGAPRRRRGDGGRQIVENGKWMTTGAVTRYCLVIFFGAR